MEILTKNNIKIAINIFILLTLSLEFNEFIPQGYLSTMLEYSR
jgi:hypothetical protein